MLRRAAVAMAVTTLAAAGLEGLAQGRPDFSGTWVRATSDAPQGTGRGRGMMGAGGFGERVIVTQTAATLKAENVQPDGTKTVWTYNLDGSPSRNEMPGRQGGPPIAAVSKATWSDGRLSIATTINLEFGGNSFSVEMTDVLSIAGDTLTVQSTRSNFQGGAPTTTTSTYKKAG